MDAVHRVAHRHKLKALFHEKPFKGINGSGKHCNWSLSTDHGENLLDPTESPEKNHRFLLFLVAILNAVHTYGALLRAGIASASNDHRLGANEAPPGIISVFLGEHLNAVLNAIVENQPVRRSSMPHVESIKVGDKSLDVKISTLPEFSRDLTDRNRTSPFAFTGNKFEFRAVGSKQSPSFPITLLNSAVAASLQEISETLRRHMGDKASPSEGDMLAVIHDYVVKTQSIRFEGDNYSDAWVKEAEVRGLLNIKKSPEAFAQLLDPKHVDMLTRNGIFSKSELQSRYHILLEKYVKDVTIEACTLHTIITTQILPAAYALRKSLAESVVALKQAVSSDAAQPEQRILELTAPAVVNLQHLVDELEASYNHVNEISDPQQQAEAAVHKILPGMERARAEVDLLEQYIADKDWPLPKYSELLFFT